METKTKTAPATHEAENMPENIGHTPNLFMPQETIQRIADKVSQQLQNFHNKRHGYHKKVQSYRLSQHAGQFINRELLFYGYPMTTHVNNGHFIQLRYRDGIYQVYLNNAETRNLVLEDDATATINVEILNNEIELDVNFYALEPYSPEATAAYLCILDNIVVLDNDGKNIFAVKGGKL